MYEDNVPSSAKTYNAYRIKELVDQMKIREEENARIEEEKRLKREAEEMQRYAKQSRKKSNKTISSKKSSKKC